MVELEEATPLNFNYSTLMKLAEDLESQTHLRDIFEMQKLIKLMGGIINYIPINNMSQNSFIEIKKESDFIISLPQELDDEMKRILLLQALGHYILHGKRGLNPCKVKSVSGSDAAREGFLFSLGLLMPDKMIVRMIEEKFSLKQIGHIFRVPEKIVEIKKGVLIKYSLLKI